MELFTTCADSTLHRLRDRVKRCMNNVPLLYSTAAPGEHATAPSNHPVDLLQGPSTSRFPLLTQDQPSYQPSPTSLDDISMNIGHHI